jgi:hypothetical protein
MLKVLLLLLTGLLLLVPEIAAARAQVDDLWTSLTVTTKHCAFVAIIRWRFVAWLWRCATKNTLASKVTKRTTVADAYKRRGPYVGFACRAKVLTLFAQKANSGSGLF